MTPPPSSPPIGCTKYKSLYPTDSTNQKIAIRRIAKYSKQGEAPRNPQQASLLAGLSVVRREFRPGTAAVDDLVDALFELLAANHDDTAGGRPSQPAKTVDSPCFSGQPE
jgi:hypothetical protein